MRYINYVFLFSSSSSRHVFTIFPFCFRYSDQFFPYCIFSKVFLGVSVSGTGACLYFFFFLSTVIMFSFLFFVFLYLLSILYTSVRKVTSKRRKLQWPPMKRAWLHLFWVLLFRYLHRPMRHHLFSRLNTPLPAEEMYDINSMGRKLNMKLLSFNKTRAQHEVEKY